MQTSFLSGHLCLINSQKIVQPSQNGNTRVTKKGGQQSSLVLCTHIHSNFGSINQFLVVNI